MLLVAGYILWQLIKWAKGRGKAEANEEYTNGDIKRLATKMDNVCDKIDNINLQQVKTHTEMEGLRDDIHNGLSTDIKNILDNNIRQWKAINTNTSDVAYLKGQERRNL